MLLRIIPFVVLFMLSACGGSESRMPDSLENTIEPVEVTKLSTSIRTPKNVVIKDQAAWLELWGEHVLDVQPQPTLPVVDFNKNMVIGIFLGAYPNSCYFTSIVSISESGSQLTVKYKVNPPAKDTVCADVVVYQSKLILVPKSSAEVTFINDTK